jgi:hypothetical protein
MVVTDVEVRVNGKVTIEQATKLVRIKSIRQSARGSKEQGQMNKGTFGTKRSAKGHSAKRVWIAVLVALMTVAMIVPSTALAKSPTEREGGGAGK